MESVASSGKTNNAYKILVRNPQESRPLGGLGVNRRIILKCISNSVEMLGFISRDLQQGLMTGS